MENKLIAPELGELYFNFTLAIHDNPPPNTHSLPVACCKVSVEYAIKVLADMKIEAVRSNRSEVGAILAIKIQELKQLIS
jgi:hypothetical protein